MSENGVSAFDCFGWEQPAQIRKPVGHRSPKEEETRGRPWPASQQICVRLKAGDPDVLTLVGQISVDSREFLTESL